MTDDAPAPESGRAKIAKIRDFLPPEERDALYAAVCENRQRFLSPPSPGAAIEGTWHWSPETEGSEPSPIRGALDVVSERLLDLLPSLFTTLEIEPFPVSELSLTLINGLDGHCGVPHADSTNGHLKISLLYYFHRKPKAFRGGDLDIFETDSSSPTGHREEAYMTIEHEDNLLLAFPSETFHGITDVRCDSRDFADGRFVAVAFIPAP